MQWTFSAPSEPGYYAALMKDRRPIGAMWLGDRWREHSVVAYLPKDFDTRMEAEFLAMKTPVEFDRAELAKRADELVGCTENSPEEFELAAISDLLDGYGEKR